MEPLLATRWSRIQLSYIEHDLVLDAVVPDPLEVLGADVRIGVADDAFFGLGRDGPKHAVDDAGLFCEDVDVVGPASSYVPVAIDEAVLDEDTVMDGTCSVVPLDAVVEAVVVVVGLVFVDADVGLPPTSALTAAIPPLHLSHCIQDSLQLRD
ncbi:unnamed protein product [Phytophthora lilii]|uniref:Unnamed protein product n=1 Tax=Phytophthora lilii TaxID=2077276 RepID=A0A9W6XT30_9STRA|nr:unnamed protein product [Phytophthora lilii]